MSPRILYSVRRSKSHTVNIAAAAARLSGTRSSASRLSRNRLNACGNVTYQTVLAVSCAAAQNTNNAAESSHNAAYSARRRRSRGAGRVQMRLGRGMGQRNLQPFLTEHVVADLIQPAAGDKMIFGGLLKLLVLFAGF